MKIVLKMDVKEMGGKVWTGFMRLMVPYKAENFVAS
jgi:hypothetical protein